MEFSVPTKLCPRLKQISKNILCVFKIFCVTSLSLTFFYKNGCENFLFFWFLPILEQWNDNPTTDHPDNGRWHRPRRSRQRTFGAEMLLATIDRRLASTHSMWRIVYAETAGCRATAAVQLLPYDATAPNQSWKQMSHKQIRLWSGEGELMALTGDSRPFVPVRPGATPTNKYQVLNEGKPLSKFFSVRLNCTVIWAPILHSRNQALQDILESGLLLQRIHPRGFVWEQIGAWRLCDRIAIVRASWSRRSHSPNSRQNRSDETNQGRSIRVWNWFVVHRNHLSMLAITDKYEIFRSFLAQNAWFAQKIAQFSPILLVFTYNLLIFLEIGPICRQITIFSFHSQLLHRIVGWITQCLADMITKWTPSERDSWATTWSSSWTSRIFCRHRTGYR